MAPKEKEEFDVSRLLCRLVLSASAFSAAAFSFCNAIRFDGRGFCIWDVGDCLQR